MKNSLRKVSLLIICSVFYTLAWCFPAYADVNSSDKWKFQIAPYAWLSGQNGKVATLPALPPADIDVDFWDDILDDLNGALMLVGEARKGRYGLVMDFMYTNIESEDFTPGPLFSTIKWKTESVIATAVGLYRLAEEERKFLDVIGGD